MSRKKEETMQATDEMAVESAVETGETTKAQADDAATRTKDTGKTAKPAKGELESMAVLANRHRIPAWQQAAILRYMGWTADKLVTDAEYQEAIEAIRNRRIGGGRK